MLADLPYSMLPDPLARTVDVKQWSAPYCLTAAAGEHEHACRAQAEADSLRTAAVTTPRPPPARPCTR
ncbi:hypothetical protein ABZ864_47360 [Streptomyces sp. NPDC047082]|uniref:hypothetical protein n=1 Tax=Streptomyces sp. NPDC047082 TaxID=3155259 RepID=UPI0033F5FEC8